MLVSVIIPIYNVEKYITRCLESVINQTYKNIEVIIVDDGSPDNSYIKAKEYLEDKTDIKYKMVQQENQGVSVARNLGRNNATGDYIMFLDSDDCIKNTFIELLVEKAKENNSDICFGGWEDISDKDFSVIGRYDENLSYCDNPISGIEACKKKISKEIWICTGTAIYRKAMLDDNNIYYSKGYAYGEDLEFINKSLLNANNVSCVKLNGLECLARTGSAIRSGFNIKFLDALIVNRHFHKYVELKDITWKDKNSLLTLIDNDYNVILFDVYERILNIYTIKECIDVIKKNNILLLDLKNQFMIKSISKRWVIEYKLLRMNLYLGLLSKKFIMKLRN